MPVQQMLSEACHPWYECSFESAVPRYKQSSRSSLNRENSPLRMLLIGFAHRVDIIRTELQQPFVELPRCPIEPVEHENQSISMTSKNATSTYFGYELSPRPNIAKFTPFKYVGGSLFSKSAFQNARAFAGRSPCPVVDTTKIVRVYENSVSCNPPAVSPNDSTDAHGVFLTGFD